MQLSTGFNFQSAGMQCYLAYKRPQEREAMPPTGPDGAGKQSTGKEKSKAEHRRGEEQARAQERKGAKQTTGKERSKAEHRKGEEQVRA